MCEQCASMREERDRLAAALVKINDIRNSIVGYQNVGISQHVYPLVAALEEAGYKGIGYERAAEMAKTQIELIAELRAEHSALIGKCRELIHEWNRRAGEMDDGTNGASSCSQAAWTLNRRADELLAILPTLTAGGPK